MALSEKLYQLRRQSGLSQEQLAEKLNVSRQAISKWESGQSFPEAEKLLAISDYFQVSLDGLMKYEAQPPEPPRAAPEPQETETKPEAAPKDGREGLWLGLIACIGGVLCLLVWGLLSILRPETAEQLAESSVIRIDGRGILLLLCVALMLTGTVLLLKNTSKK